MSDRRAKDWLHQAENDFLWAEDSAASGHYYGACFLSQQVADKSLKSIALFQGYDQVRSHSVLSICIALKINGELEKMARVLDQYYISTRYPDGLPEGHAGLFYTEDQAKDALEKAKKFLEYARKILT